MFLIDTLPSEIWTAIIKEYITITNYEDCYGEFTYMEVDRLLPLLLISAGWRDHILATPTLWTDMLLSDYVEDLEMKVVMALHFSGEAPIAVYLREGRCCSAMASILIQERSRISSIWMMVDYGHRSKQQFALLSTLSPLPTLSRLRCSEFNHYTLEPRVWDMHPLLTDIYGFDIDPADLVKIPRALHSIYVVADPKGALSTIEGIKSLRVVTFAKAIGEFDHGHNSEPLGWESLKLVAADNKSCSCLLNRLRYTLTHLDIYLSIGARTLDLILSLGHLERLYDCSIRISSRRDDYELTVDPLTVTYKCNARRLAINATDTSGKAKSIEILGQTLQAMMPFIDELNLSFEDSDELLSFLSGPRFSKITSLSLSCSNVAPYHYNRGFMGPFPHLIYLRTNLPLTMLNPERSSAVERIQYRGYQQQNIDMTEFDEWKQIRSLDIQNSITNLSFDKFSLPHLRRFVLGEFFDSTDLCHHLALHPHSCPMLKNLELHSTPEWDILFIMLERRNLSQYPVVPLAQIALPDICARYLRRPIHQVMRGLVPVRPSYYDLSVRIQEDLINSDMYVLSLEAFGC
jgi:hypothetical protein